MDQRLKSLMFSSTRPDWETPWAIFNVLDAEFHFTLDAAATQENAKCADYITPEEDAFTRPWEGVVFLNPPYGRSIGKWIQKAWDEAQAGAVVVLLLPARTDTRWFHDLCTKGEVRFLRGRIHFEYDDGEERGKYPAPFPSMVVIFRKEEGDGLSSGSN